MRIHITAWAIAYTLSFGFTSLAVADVAEHKKPCSPVQKATADKAFVDAKAGLAKAAATLKSPSPSDTERQQKWFGAMSSASAEAVRKVYENSLGQASFAQYWCPSRNDLAFKWDSGDLAAVHKDAPGSMFLTPDFFKLGNSGPDSQMGTLIHELSHLAGVGFKPEVYGTVNAKNLAKADPTKAKNNSDNYQYYVEDLLFGLP